MATAAMFLNQLTVLDHAYIDDEGRVIGGSFNPDFIVAGEIDPVEQVVVDFSTVKKDMKKIIDDKENGFDHKLWFIEGYSKGELTHFEDESGSNSIQIKTPALFLEVPANAVRIFEANDYSLHDIGRALGAYVQEEMQKSYPTIRIVCNNNTTAHVISNIPAGYNGILPPVAPAPSFFTYVHGLKDSTSWGCQNNSHGHLSFLQLFPSNTYTRLLQDSIANALDGVIFIKEENLIDEDSLEWPGYVSIRYTTGRGTFLARYKRECFDIVVTEAETTIENLVNYVTDFFKKDLEETGVEEVYMSEGLSKGALVQLTQLY